jgi:hypothetical protein
MTDQSKKEKKFIEMNSSQNRLLFIEKNWFYFLNALNTKIVVNIQLVYAESNSP